MKPQIANSNRIPVFLTLLFISTLSFSQNNSPFRLFVSGDDCADFTWGYDENTTRDNSVKLISAYLDEMKLTDNQSFENKTRYTTTVTNEMLFFLDTYPGKRDELMQRIKEGRIMISPFLCNTLWGLASSETFLRSMYPAARLAKEAGVSMNHGVHSELPSLPAGIVPLLTGSGIDWISKPYLDFDCTFARLRCPPLFILKGADHSLLKVSLDHWACQKAGYWQGGEIVKQVTDKDAHKNDSVSIVETWINHYRSLQNYPLNAALAEGIHGDLSPLTWQQPPVFSDAIITLNANADGKYKITNSTFRMFTDYADSVQKKHAFMDTLKGSFGISWEVWPVSQVKYAVGLREQERRLYKAEALLALHGDVYNNNPGLYKTYKEAEWNLVMLTDHAYNGTSDENRKVNSDLRVKWLIKTDSLISIITQQAIRYIADNDNNKITLFNPCSSPLRHLYALNTPDMKGYLNVNIQPLGFQTFSKDEINKKLIEFIPEATPVKKPVFLAGINMDNLLRVTYKRDSSDYAFKAEYFETAGSGELTYSGEKGNCADIKVSKNWTVIPGESRADLVITAERPKHAKREVFSLDIDLPWDKSDLLLETTGEFLKPYPAPRGSLLPGADTTRFVFQNFISCDPGNNKRLLILSPDAFVVVNDKNKISIQLFANVYDKNEAQMNQNNETVFTFRFTFLVTENLRADEIIRTSREIVTGPLVFKGSLADKSKLVDLKLIPEGIIITSLKPAEPAFGKGIIMKVWNTSASNSEFQILSDRYNRITKCNLLEINSDSSLSFHGKFKLSVSPMGYTCFRLETVN